MARRRPAEHASTRSIRVLLAEDMDLLRTALVSVLSVEEDMEVVADLKCDQKVISVALRLRPDVAVVAADLPDTRGVYTVSELRRRLPECQIVALTVTRPPGVLRRLLAAQVHGLIDKNAPACRLLAAIRDVAGGGTMIDANLVVAALAADRNPFTPREVHVLKLAAGGATGPEIARTLSLSPGTVRNYLSNAMNKTGARTRIDAIRIATESGWL
ncbi:MAG: response regulator transcription factor [Actinophytocola sp.]|uniref:response regulator transcription factor n=1 Tax=Actinophytocola sp. TaxID=1872138 RepID=UPI003D6A013A